MKKQSTTSFLVLISILLLALSSMYNTLSIRKVHDRLNKDIEMSNSNNDYFAKNDRELINKIGELQRQIDNMKWEIGQLNNSEDIHWNNITSNYREMKYLERILWLEKKVDNYVYKVIMPMQEEDYARRMKEKYPNN